MAISFPNSPASGTNPMIDSKLLLNVASGASAGYGVIYVVAYF